MSLPSTFSERLHQMEETRNHRLALLHAERELQSKKAQLLAEKLSGLRRMEQRCLLLERRRAELDFHVLASKAEIDALDPRRDAAAQESRELRSEIDEMETREKESDGFYEAKRLEMEEFKEQVRKCVSDSRADVESIRKSVSELKSTLEDLQANDGYQNNPEIAAAEARRAELLATKENLDKSFSSNYKLRSLLQKQLKKMLISQDKGRSQGAAKNDAMISTQKE